MKKSIVIYPFLFAIFPVLALYAYNIGQLSLNVIWPPLLFCLGLALVLFILSLLILRDAAKAGLVAAVLIIIFFADGHLVGVLQRWQWSWVANYVLPVIWGMFFVISVYLIYRTKRRLHNLTIILNVLGVCLIVVSSFNVVVGELRRPNIQPETQLNGQQVVLGNITTYPDIYYIILDSYARSDMLEEYWNYDNSEFTDYLKAKGFYVADQSTSNYGYSEASSASTLNMEYINYLSDQLGENSKNLYTLINMLKDNRVASFLRSVGYHYVFFDTGGLETSFNKYADINIDCVPKDSKTLFELDLNPFTQLLSATTILNRFQRESLTSFYRETVLNSFDKLAQMPTMEGPKFVLALINVPHPPYVFGANGERVEISSATENMFEPISTQKEKYLNQLEFATRKVETVIDEIMSKSERPPVIILQSDHGSRLFQQFSNGNPTDVKEGFSILNAYYLPNVDETALYKTISPVNTFKVVLNSYFGTDYDLLNDQSYYSAIFTSPYKFIDVTDQVRSTPLGTTPSPTPTGTPTPTATPTHNLILYSTADSRVVAQSPTDNFGTDTFVGIQAHQSSGRQRGLFQFDLSSIPPGSTINSATFSADYDSYLAAGADPVGRTYYLYRITGPWTETGVTWSNQPGYTASQGASAIMPASFGWVNWNVKDIVQSWVNGTANYGFMMIDSDETPGTINKVAVFDSKESAGSIYAPRLMITYTAPAPTTPTPSDTATPTPTAT